MKYTYNKHDSTAKKLLFYRESLFLTIEPCDYDNLTIMRYYARFMRKTNPSYNFIHLYLGQPKYSKGCYGSYLQPYIIAGYYIYL